MHELITIIGNLLNNAVDALQNSPIKKIELGIFWDDNVLTVKVADTGSGIDKAKQQNIFSRGYSTKGAQRGMGLYLIRQTLDRSGGQITLSSEKGKGTTFCVIIPYWAKEENND